jgi:AraC family transcriptional regulator, regulatory protein of adaptative response / methylphosphotriester-DNA alkyltransferase methyltransferase
MVAQKVNVNSNRPGEIVSAYLKELDKHLLALKQGKAENTFTIKDLAALLFIHPTHLSNTIKQVLGKSPCDVYEERLIEIAKELIIESKQSIAEVARTLTYDPSNFSKFFKSYVGITPNQFRLAHSS